MWYFKGKMNTFKVCQCGSSIASGPYELPGFSFFPLWTVHKNICQVHLCPFSLLLITLIQKQFHENKVWNHYPHPFLVLHGCQHKAYVHLFLVLYTCGALFLLINSMVFLSRNMLVFFKNAIPSNLVIMLLGQT